ncbi:MAG: hypothetical protein V3T33_00330 [Myxococcota bacterium]
MRRSNRFSSLAVAAVAAVTLGGCLGNPAAPSKQHASLAPDAAQRKESESVANTEELAGAWAALLDTHQTIWSYMESGQLDRIPDLAVALPGLAENLLKHGDSLPERRRARLEAAVDRVRTSSVGIKMAAEKGLKGRTRNRVFRFGMLMYSIQGVLPPSVLKPPTEKGEGDRASTS